MSVPRLLILVSMLTLTGCAAHMPPAAIECSPPPALPEAVLKQAESQQETYSKRARWLLDWFETQIGIGRR